MGENSVNAGGRPRTAGANVRRLVKAAAEHRRTAEALADQLRAGEKPRCPREIVKDLDPDAADLADHIAARMSRFARKQIEALVGHLGIPAAQLIADVEGGNALALLRARGEVVEPEVLLGRDEFTDQAAAAALALDRLVGPADVDADPTPLSRMPAQ